MILYKLTNRKTGLSYIGATTRPRLNDRLSLHRHRADEGVRTSVLHEAIRVDGWENFEAAILAQPATFDELMAMEQAAITTEGTLTPNGYNMTAGGVGQWLRPMTELAKRAISEANSGRHPWNFGKATGPMSDEARQKMSVARQGRTPWNKGVAMSATARANMSAGHHRRAGEHYRARPIEFEGVTYSCLKDACQATGLTKMQMQYRLQKGLAIDRRVKE